MAQKILVSLVSDQTIPNVLFIKEMGQHVDQYLFVSTQDMEKKNRSNCIIEATQLKKSKTRIETIEPYDTEKIRNKLNIVCPADNQYIVNLTCGTKLSFLACYQFFKRDNNKLYYLTIGQNEILQLEPEENKIKIQHRLNVMEYLTAYNVIIESEHNLTHKPVHTKNIFNQAKNRAFVLEEIKEIKNSQQNSCVEYRSYYAGGWFEEYIYNEIKQNYSLSDKDILLNVNLFHKEIKEHHDNEFDVVFTKDNKLYVIEAKAFRGKKVTMRKIEPFLYKLAALNKNIGLSTLPYLILTADIQASDKQFRESLPDKLQILNIKAIIDQNLLIDQQLFFNHLN